MEIYRSNGCMWWVVGVFFFGFLKFEVEYSRHLWGKVYVHERFHG